MKEPLRLDEAEVVVIHDRLLAEHGGRSGLRDRGLLASALARPRSHHAYGNAPDVIQLAAVYTAGILRNHPFVDGNKRTGFVAGVLFLEINGCRFVADEADATQAVMSLAAGTIDQARFAAWLRKNVEL